MSLARKPDPTDRRENESGVFCSEAQGGAVMRYDLYDDLGRWRGEMTVPSSDDDHLALETARMYLAQRNRLIPHRRQQIRLATS